jgi:hypothetical protein
MRLLGTTRLTRPIQEGLPTSSSWDSSNFRHF